MKATTSGLSLYADQINEHHRAVGEALKSGLLHAKAAGDLLLKAKEEVSHGGWLPWLRDHCDVSERAAQSYMRIAKRWPELESKAQRAADLSYRDGLRLLASEATADESGIVVEDDVPAHRSWFAWEKGRMKDTVRQWPDIMHTFALVADALGWTAERIADHLGADLEEVRLFLCPVVPVRFDKITNLGGDLFKGRDVIAAAYATQVREGIAGLMWVSYMSASRLAEREGLPEIAAEMKGCERQQERHRRRLSAQDLFSESIRWRDEDLRLAFWCLSREDVRLAVGIDKPTDERWITRFNMYLDIVKQQRAAIANN